MRPVQSVSLRDLVEPLFRYKWTFLASVLVVALPVTLYSFYRFKYSPVFEARSKILVERTTVNKLLQLAPVLEYGRLDSEIELILSRPVLEAAIHKLRLDSKFSDDELDSISKGLAVVASPKGNILTILLRHTNEQVIAPFVNALTDEYILRRRSINRNMASAAASFFEKEQERVANQLDKFRNSLSAFKSSSHLYAVEEQQRIYLVGLEEARSDIAKADARIEFLSEKAKSVSAELKKERDALEIAPYVDRVPSVISRIEEVLVELELKRDEMLRRFSRKDKDVLLIEEQIRRMESRLFDEKKRALLGQMKKVELEIDDLERRKKASAEQMALYQDKIADIEKKRLVLDEYSQTISDLTGIRADLIRSIHKLREIGEIEQYGSISVYKIEEAVDPEEPVEPRPILYSVLSVIVGIGFGVAVVALSNFFDHSVRDASDVANYLRLPLVASFVHVGGVRGRAEGFLWEKVGEIGAACRRTYDGALGNGDGQRHRAVAFVSARSGEGATTVALNVATFLCRSLGQTVLFVAGGSGAREVAARLGEENPPIGAKEEAAVETGTPMLVAESVPNLHVLDLSEEGKEQTGGGVKKMLDGNSKKFDTIIIDCPPILAAPEALRYCDAADGVFCVIEAEKTRVQTANYAQSMLKEVGIDCAGVILNKVKRRIPNWIYRLL